MCKKDHKKAALRVVTTVLLSTIFVLSSCEMKYSTQVVPSAIPVNTQLTFPTDIPKSTATIDPTNTAEPTPTTDTFVKSDKTFYDYSVELDYNKHILYVEETIKYINHTGNSIGELIIIVPPNSKEEVIKIKELRIDDVSTDEYSLDGIILTVPLSRTLEAEGSVEVYFNYELTPAYNGGILGYTKNQMNLSDWYPFIPPYDPDSGWVVNLPAEVGEYLVYDKANFSLILAITGSDNVVVASSTGAKPVAEDIYQMDSLNARNLTFSVSNKYQEFSKQFGTTIVSAYVFEGDEDAGWAAIENTGRALISFSALFGEAYPNETMTIVESDFPDGMEYDGLYYLSKTYFKAYNGTYENYLSLLSVHETAHQWWFAMVGSDQANEPWLDEMLATYSEYLYTEQFYPEFTDWWWDYRVNNYEPKGWVDKAIYDETDLRSYINTVYLQGASFMHELRIALGDEAFFNGLKSYVAENSDKNATWGVFLSTMGVDQSAEASNVVDRYFQSY